MVFCKHCQSKFNLKQIHHQWEEDGWSVTKITVYQCQCCKKYTTTHIHYNCEDAYEEVQQENFFPSIFGY